MAKAVSLVCILALASIAHSIQVFNVEGDVYCDPCGVQFATKFSEPLAGAAVKLQCMNVNTNKVTYSASAVTDAKGHYKISVEGDHHADICEVEAVSSPRPNCSNKSSYFVKSKVECPSNAGAIKGARFANPIGFMTKDVLPGCSEVMKD